MAVTNNLFEIMIKFNFIPKINIFILIDLNDIEQNLLPEQNRIIIFVQVD